EALVAERAFHRNLHEHALFTFRYADPKWPIFVRILVLSHLPEEEEMLNSTQLFLFLEEENDL
ncbi:MAG TPA: hypothetical protein DHV65_11585, partial [Ktedonobacter sp.]|nr:hypothetical protein [Ktedonobacter sp.]